jgi:hypothetical protein
MTSDYVCCFCNQRIERRGFDIGCLLYTTNYDRAPEDRREQELYCHAKCLEEAVNTVFRPYLIPNAFGEVKGTQLD